MTAGINMMNHQTFQLLARVCRAGCVYHRFDIAATETCVVDCLPRALQTLVISWHCTECESYGAVIK